MSSRVAPGKQRTLTNDFFVDKRSASILYNIESPTRYTSFLANDLFLVDCVAFVLGLLLLSCSSIVGGGGGGGGWRQRGLKSTIHASLAVKSTIHMLSYTKSKSTHTKFKKEEGKPKNTIFKLNTFQCCHRIIVTRYFLTDFTQINAWSHLQHFLATSVHYVLHSKRFQSWPGLTDHILH